MWTTNLHVYVTITVVCSGLLACLLVRLYDRVLLRQVGNMQYTKLGTSDGASKQPLGAALQPILYAFICGSAGGYTNLFLKGVAELVKNLTNGDGSAFRSPTVYLFILAALLCAAMQIIWINKGLALFPAVKFVASTQAIPYRDSISHHSLIPNDASDRCCSCVDAAGVLGVAEPARFDDWLGVLPGVSEAHANWRGDVAGWLGGCRGRHPHPAAERGAAGGRHG